MTFSPQDPSLKLLLPLDESQTSMLQQMLCIWGGSVEGVLENSMTKLNPKLVCDRKPETRNPKLVCERGNPKLAWNSEAS